MQYITFPKGQLTANKINTNENVASKLSHFPKSRECAVLGQTNATMDEQDLSIEKPYNKNK